MLFDDAKYIDSVPVMQKISPCISQSTILISPGKVKMIATARADMMLSRDLQ